MEDLVVARRRLTGVATRRLLVVLQNALTMRLVIMCLPVVLLE